MKNLCLDQKAYVDLEKVKKTTLQIHKKTFVVYYLDLIALETIKNCKQIEKTCKNILCTSNG